MEGRWKIGTTKSTKMEFDVRQRHKAIFRAFAATDVHQHALRVDVAHLQVQGFLHPQPERVYGPEEALKHCLLDGADEQVRFIDRQHGWELQLVFAL
jgi:hypothetical protein